MEKAQIMNCIEFIEGALKMEMVLSDPYFTLEEMENFLTHVRQIIKMAHDQQRGE